MTSQSHATTSGDAQFVLRAARHDDIPAIDAMHFLSVQGLGAGDYTPAEIELFLGHLGTYDPALIDDGTCFVLAPMEIPCGSGAGLPAVHMAKLVAADGLQATAA